MQSTQFLGRPRAPRRVVHPDFIAAVAAAPFPRRKLAEWCGIKRDRLANILRDKPFAATPQTLSRLRKLALCLDYEGIIIGSTLPIRRVRKVAR